MTVPGALSRRGNPSEVVGDIFDMKDKRYVVGFLFNYHNQVALILKARPDWQKGRLNGIGGHIEEEESPEEAMEREFLEEAGVLIKDWRRYCRVYGEKYELFCLTARLNCDIRTMTDEKVAWYLLDDLPDNLLSNSKWLIPMANYENLIQASVYHPRETC